MLRASLPGSPLTTADLEKLERSGILVGDAERAMLRRVTSIEGGELVGRNGGGDYSGVIFPYINPGEQHIREIRLRRDRPEFDQQPDGSIKERNKYLSPPGRGNMLYFAPGTHPEWLTDTSLRVVITEGEKKALALQALAFHALGDAAELPRFLTVGLSGVWNWRSTIGKAPGPDGDRRDVKGPIADLNRILWERRRVSILFDANVGTNASVRAARKMLSNELRGRGAHVDFIELPDIDGINGIDDLIGLWGRHRVLEDVISRSVPDEEAMDARAISTIEQLPRVEDIDSSGTKYVIEGLIAQGAIHLFTGESGCGKSTLLSAAAHKISQGLPFLGRRTLQLPVLLLDAENPQPVVLDRFRRIHVESHDGFRVWGQWVGEDPPSAGGAIILEWVARCDPKPLIVIDSLIAFHPGAENDSSETRRYFAQYRKLAAMGATIAILHHIGKSETARDYRGSSDIKASIDVGYKLTSLGDGTRLSLLELRAFKQRISVEPYLSLRYADGSFVTDERELPKTIPERLCELLAERPGITTREFERLAGERKLGRNRAREFLRNGATHGRVRIESGSDNRKLHYWQGEIGSASFLERA